MILADVNVLIYAMSPHFSHHKNARAWLVGALEGSEQFGTWEPLLASVYRITTHRKTYGAEPAKVLAYLNEIRASSNHVRLVPSPRMWEIFDQLARNSKVVGAKTSDMLVAALTIDQRATLYSYDADFDRFEGLNWVYL